MPATIMTYDIPTGAGSSAAALVGAAVGIAYVEVPPSTVLVIESADRIVIATFLFGLVAIASTRNCRMPFQTQVENVAIGAF
jgi:hypothetical protein